MRKRRFLRAVGLVGAACYVEEGAEGRHIVNHVHRRWVF